MQSMISLAHVRQDSDGNWHEHPLDEHLRCVAELAGTCGEKFGGADWARLAGLWHDLGKYRPAFQAYIKSASGYDPEAHVEGSTGRVDHSTAGALHAIERLDPAAGRVIAYLIAGHHAGLPDWNGQPAALFQRLENCKAQGWLDEVLKQHPPVEITDALVLANPRLGGPDSCHLWLRMLFSCLVDADFLDTEKFMSPSQEQQRGDYPSLEALLERFDAHMHEKTAAAIPTVVNRLRADVLRQCRERAAESPGLFSLTVPTGGGKTLSSLAFALTHAVKHNKRRVNRVIYAIPYTSIIEQTADIFRGIFGEAVIEHHSNLDPDKETARSRLASENWDAPLIVTTNVQLFESLFAARPSHCRKLHNIVNSVIVLDEAQLLPPDFLDPILAMLRDLSQHYGVTVLISTATQPAFSPREGFDWKFPGLPGVREIIADPDSLYEDLRRVQVLVPTDLRQTQSWDGVAERISPHRQCLAIVNRRNDARELATLLPDAIHLSANLCGEHRSTRIKEVKARLADREPVRVVTTQLIEAGVDVDFPVVFRALAGLDSIAQAAGRCNREGVLCDAAGNPRVGDVILFVPPKPSPSGLLLKGEQAAREILAMIEGDPLTRELFERYFVAYYASLNTLDKEGIVDLLTRDARELKVQFRTAAQRFRLIDDEAQCSLIVRYGEAEKWLAMLRKQGPERRLMRKLQRYSVSIPERCHRRLVDQCDLEEVIPGFYAQAVDGLYGERFGFTACSEAPLSPSSLAL